MKRFIVFSVVMLFSIGALSGCSSRKFVNRAQTAFEQAKTADAEARAPFEYYAAEAYLGLAEDELEVGHDPQAEIFAEDSEKYSAEALELTGGGAR